jgi:hypothetical protein
MWINHLRQWSRNDENAARLGLSSATVRQMAEIIIISSYRLNMPEQLQKIMQRDTAWRRSCTPPLVILSPGWVMPMFRKRSALPAACRKAALCSPPRVLARRNG